jgi:hypothetical protein
MPDHLLNMICAIASRFSPVYSQARAGNEAGRSMTTTTGTELGNAHDWASRAKDQVTKQLDIASEELVQTMVLIGWYEFGQDRDGVSD